MAEKITRKQLLDYYHEAADLNGQIEYLNKEKTIYGGKKRHGYAFGENGTMYTKQKAQANTDAGRKVPKGRNKKTYFLVDCAHWFGRICADCSGTIIAAIRRYIKNYKDQTADSLFAGCTKKGEMDTMPEIPGICLHKPGHIGVYDGNGWVVECRSTAMGTVRSRIETQKWTGWGYLAAVDYSDVQGSTKPVEKPQEPQPGKPLSMVDRYGKDIYKAPVKGKDGKPVTPYQKGQGVVNLQRDLILFDAKYKSIIGKVDGAYGDMTAEAILSFQKRVFPNNKKEWDGKAGDKTKQKLFDALIAKGLIK